MSRRRHRTHSGSESSSSTDSEVEDNDNLVQLNQEMLDQPLAGHLRRHRIKPVENTSTMQKHPPVPHRQSSYASRPTG